MKDVFDEVADGEFLREFWPRRRRRHRQFFLVDRIVRHPLPEARIRDSRVPAHTEIVIEFLGIRPELGITDAIDPLAVTAQVTHHLLALLFRQRILDEDPDRPFNRLRGMSPRRHDGEKPSLAQGLLERIVARPRLLAMLHALQRIQCVENEAVVAVVVRLVRTVLEIDERRRPAAIGRRTVVLLVRPHERKRRRRHLHRLPDAVFLQVLHLDLRRHMQDVVIPVEDVVLEVAIRDIFVHIWNPLLQTTTPMKSKPLTFSSRTLTNSPTSSQST